MIRMAHLSSVPRPDQSVFFREAAACLVASRLDRVSEFLLVIPAKAGIYETTSSPKPRAPQSEGYRGSQEFRDCVEDAMNR